MIIIPRRYFWTALVLTVATVFGLGFYSWYILPRDSAAVKFLAERIVFFSIIGAASLGSLSIILFLRARSQSQAAENLMASQRWMEDGGRLLEERLGDLGRNFHRINNELIQTNRRRGIKIRGMNALLAFLVKNFESPILVVNAAGEIVYVSTEYLDKTGENRSDLVKKQINAVLSEMYFPEIIAEFGRSPVMIARQSGGRNYELYNIMDGRGEIVYVVISPSGRNFQLIVGNPDQDNMRNQTRRRFSWLFGGNQPRKG